MPLITQNPNLQAGLVKASASQDLPQPVRSQRIADPKFKGVAVDMRWLNRTDLLTYVEGSSWIVDYYSQVLDTDSQLSGQQLSVDPAYQQYTKIVKLELKVQQALVTSQTDDTKGMVMEGSSIVFPLRDVIPNEGDMFVVDIGEGEKGVFRVTQTVKKSIFKEACYEISYSIDTDQDDKQEDLDRKVVKTVFFHKDRMQMGKDPLLIRSEHDVLLRTQDVYDVLCRQYFKLFFSDEYKTLLVPLQRQSTYDYFLVDFLLDTFTTEDSEEIRYVRRLAMGGDPVFECHHFWTILKNRNPAYLKTAFKQVGAVSTKVLSAVPLINGIKYTGILNTVYPLDPQLVINNHMQTSRCSPLASPLETQEPPTGGLYQMIESLNTANLTPEEGTLKPVLQDAYYVLSKSFYDHDLETMDTFERFVWEYLEGKPMDAAALVATAEIWPTWGRMEQFYYIPILMHLLKSVIYGE